MFKKVLPHILIILSTMFLVFLVVDIFNAPMAFVNNNITKTLMFIQCILVILLSILYIAKLRKE
ncbi:MAG: hypothetical protein R2876_02630 [Eubacteriales bacterium]